MTTYSKFNIIYRLQKWLDSVPGQTFMNYAYSWGASIVILGALFKLTHLPGANLMLFLGMGTEVLVFFIAGFDRPFDKTEDGKELPTHVIDDEQGEAVIAGGSSAGTGTTVIGGSGGTGGTIVIGGGDGSLPEGAVAAMDEGEGTGGVIIGGGGGVIGGGGGVIGGGGGVIGGGGGVIGGGGGVIGGGGGVIGGGGGVIGGGGGVIGGGTDEAGENVSTEGSTRVIGGTFGGGGVIGGIINQQPELPNIDPEEMEEATQNYVEQLKNLTETLKKVSEQSERLTRDSEEMENLNRTLTGICKVYEMQLKGASQQIGTIDQINKQSKRMAEQIAELNKIYTRMIEAMTVNMPKAPTTPLNQ